MSKTALQIVPATPFAGLNITGSPTGIGDRKVGQKLTALYRDAQAAELAILRFGAAFWAVEQVVLSTCGQNSGPGAYGFASWLRDHAPEISRTTAIRYRDIAEATAEKFKIADPVRVFSLPVEELDEQERAKREKVVEFVADKSMRGIQLELGLVESRGRGGYHPSEVAVARWLEEHHADLAGTAYADLPKALQTAFQKSGYNERDWRPMEEQQRAKQEAAVAMFARPVRQLHADLDRSDWHPYVSPAELTGLRRELKDALAKIDRILRVMEGQA